MATRHEVLDSLTDDPLDPGQVLDGDPKTSDLTLTDSGSEITGLWRCTPGRFTDVELEETFVVMEGSAEIEFSDGSRVNLGPGDAHSFEAGEKTVWTVQATLLKFYWARTGPPVGETSG